MNSIQPGFVNIQTLFDEESSRSISELSKLYKDKSLLQDTLSSLSAEVLTPDFIRGKKILLKPNWVRHPKKPSDESCLIAHHEFVLAVMEIILKMSPASVVLGDAPIQGCNWNKMIPSHFLDRVKQLSHQYEVPVQIKDFRRVAFDPETNQQNTERNPMSEYLIFDVGKKSYLEPITPPGKNLFRVTLYNPDKFVHTHGPGMHKYCITKELFKADVVISIPKIKTHQKAGITGALKNIVGLNGDKDFLPHHRIGGTKMGGDSYDGKNLLRYWSELALDNANRNKGKKIYWFWVRTAAMMWRLSLPGKKHQLAAGWYGNDTTWRMVMDLNTIINFGRADGTIAETPQRFLFSFSDGIVGGQGNGPLQPDPLNLGVVGFSNDSATTDICMATLMGMNVDKIPLLVAAKSFMPNRKVEIKLNGEQVHLDTLKKYATKAIPPPGWIDYENN